MLYLSLTLYLPLFGYACLVIYGGVLKNYSGKPFHNWCWQRRLYFSCYSAIALISFINGLRAFIENPTFNFYAQIALGIQWILFVFVPCGIEFFNKPWPRRRLRDLLFICIGALFIYRAFHL